MANLKSESCNPKQFFPFFLQKLWNSEAALDFLHQEEVGKAVQLGKREETVTPEISEHGWARAPFATDQLHSFLKRVRTYIKSPNTTPLFEKLGIFPSVSKL